MKKTESPKEKAIIDEARKLAARGVFDDRDGWLFSLRDLDEIRALAHKTARLIQKQGQENSSEALVILAQEIKQLGDGGFQSTKLLGHAFKSATQRFPSPSPTKKQKKQLNPFR